MEIVEANSRSDCCVRISILGNPSGGQLAHGCQAAGLKGTRRDRPHEGLAVGTRRDAVVHELDRAIDAVEPKDYAEHILRPRAERSGRLKISDPRLMEYVPDFADDLTNLDLSLLELDDVNGLANLTRLTALNLRGTQVVDINPLAGLTHLTELDLYGTQVSDISVLAKLPQLTRLNLGFTQVTDLKRLVDAPNLAWLDLRWTQISEETIPQELKDVEIVSSLLERSGKR